jgi:F-type H+-transporting ATPase subunit b
VSAATRARAAACLALLLAPAVALAAEEAGGEHGGASLFWHALNLALIVGVIVYFARSPIRAFMADRRQSIEQGIEGAQRELAEAERRLAECNERVASLDREVAEILDTVRVQAHAERERLLADAQAAADRIRRDAQVAVEQEARRARDGLRAEAAELSVRLAGDLVQRQIGDADRARLVDDFVDGIATPTARS